MKKSKQPGRPAKTTQGKTFAGRFGKELRRRRLASNLTLQEMARRTDGEISAAMISQYEMGRYKPRLDKVVAMCVALGCTIADVLPGDVRRLVGVFSRRPKRGQLLKSLY